MCILISGGTVTKNPPANSEDAGDTGSIPGLGRSAREGNGNSFQYSCLENSMDREAWQATVQGIAKGLTQINMHSSISFFKIIFPCWESQEVTSAPYQRECLCQSKFLILFPNKRSQDSLEEWAGAENIQNKHVVNVGEGSWESLGLQGDPTSPS